MNIVNVGYDSTNYYVLGPDSARLLVDCGWPGTLPRLLANLKRKDIPFRSVRYSLVTHYHPDHAGLAQELKGQGLRLIVLESQLPAIPMLKTFMKPDSGYVDITLHDNLELTFDESQASLQRLGIAGEIIGTPGHSDDSVTLVLHTGIGFTGDLPSPALADDGTGAAITQSWQRLRARGVTRIYPGHGPARPLPLDDLLPS